MLKYVAILRATDRAILNGLGGSTSFHNAMSPFSPNRDETRRWLVQKLKEYPPDRYIIRKALIAFDDDESINAEEELKQLLYVT